MFFSGITPKIMTFEYYPKNNNLFRSELYIVDQTSVSFFNLGLDIQISTTISTDSILNIHHSAVIVIIHMKLFTMSCLTVRNCNITGKNFYPSNQQLVMCYMDPSHN